MKGRTHLAVGVGSALTLMTIIAGGDTNYPYGVWGPMMLGTIVIATMLPDIDSEESIISNRTELHRCASTVISGITGGHRGIMHTPFFVGLLGILFFILNILAKTEVQLLLVRILGPLFLFGYSLHLFLDMFTPMGIKLLYPISNRYFSFHNPEKVYDLGKEKMLYSIFFILDVYLLFTR